MTVFKTYLALTKPRIIGLLLVTTVPAMMLAQSGMPSGWLIAATVLGGYLTAGSANAFNQYLDRDIDRIMLRTRARPIPSGALNGVQVIVFASALGLVGAVWLGVTVNWAASALAVFAIFFYVVVYTIALKRNTSQNIVIGGAAGAVPALIGWAAVTGTLSGEAWLLFLLIFLWTPPHFWALAVKYRDDYASAGVPMLPVVASLEETSKQILAYSLVLVVMSFTLALSNAVGPIYLVSAVVLGAGFLVLAWRLWKAPGVPAAMNLFRYSILYLALLFAAVAVDSLI